MEIVIYSKPLLLGGLLFLIDFLDSLLVRIALFQQFCWNIFCFKIRVLFDGVPAVGIKRSLKGFFVICLPSFIYGCCWR